MHGGANDLQFQPGDMTPKWLNSLSTRRSQDAIMGLTPQIDIFIMDYLHYLVVNVSNHSFRIDLNALEVRLHVLE